MSEFFLLGVDPIWKDFAIQGSNLFPFSKWQTHIEVYSLTL